MEHGQGRLQLEVGQLQGRYQRLGLSPACALDAVNFEAEQEMSWQTAWGPDTEYVRPAGAKTSDVDTSQSTHKYHCGGQSRQKKTKPELKQAADDRSGSSQ